MSGEKGRGSQRQIFGCVCVCVSPLPRPHLNEGLRADPRMKDKIHYFVSFMGGTRFASPALDNGSTAAVETLLFEIVDIRQDIQVAVSLILFLSNW